MEVNLRAEPFVPGKRNHIEVVRNPGTQWEGSVDPLTGWDGRTDA
jgi:hypothetical protein